MTNTSRSVSIIFYFKNDSFQRALNRTFCPMWMYYYYFLYTLRGKNTFVYVSNICTTNECHTKTCAKRRESQSTLQGVTSK